MILGNPLLERPKLALVEPAPSLSPMEPGQEAQQGNLLPYLRWQVKQSALPALDFLRKGTISGSCTSWQDAHSTRPLMSFTSGQPVLAFGGRLNSEALAEVG